MSEYEISRSLGEIHFNFGALPEASSTGLPKSREPCLTKYTV